MSSHYAPSRPPSYDHAALERRRRILHWMIVQIGFRVLIKVGRVEGLHYLPREGPAILMINHVALLDPIVVVGCVPRHIVPVAKAEGFRNPVFAALMRIWQVIPISRGEVDRKALRRILRVLAAGEIVLLAPEGTRHAALHEARPGVAYLAYKSCAPIVPIGLEGTQGFPTLSPARWRRPGAEVHLGRPFRFRSFAGRPGREQLRHMMDEAMYVLAAMLPPDRRGAYADLSQATTDTIEFV
jgi:1-acyl-sn-glycerol-3-phosphate acyltransferase